MLNVEQRQHDRRASHRVKVLNWPAKILTEDAIIDGTTRNVGGNGAYILYDLPYRSNFSLGQRNRLALIIKPPNRLPLLLNAEVARSDILSSDEKNILIGVGLNFIELHYENRQFLRSLVTEYCKARLTRATAQTSGEGEIPRLRSKQQSFSINEQSLEDRYELRHRINRKQKETKTKSSEESSTNWMISNDLLEELKILARENDKGIQQILAEAAHDILLKYQKGSDDAAKSLIAGKERRVHSRVETTWPVKIVTSQGPVQGEIRDISKGGALIRCHDLPITDETFELRIEIPGHLLKVSATVEKVRLTIDEGDCTCGSFDLAVRFLEINLEQRNILYNAIEHQSQKDEKPKAGGTSLSLHSIPPKRPQLTCRTDRPSKNFAPLDTVFDRLD